MIKASVSTALAAVYLSGSVSALMCPITHRYKYTANDGRDYCCAYSDNKIDDESGFSIDAHFDNDNTKSCRKHPDGTVGWIRCENKYNGSDTESPNTCVDWSYGATCPSNKPFAYRPTALNPLDFCCGSSDKDNNPFANSNPDYDDRYDSCASNAYVACSDPPCRDYGRYHTATDTDYIGCYRDGGGVQDHSQRIMQRLGDHEEHEEHVGNISACKSLAKKAGYAYFAVQYKGQCFGGDSFDDFGRIDDEECLTTSCASGEACGGSWASAVYSTESVGITTCTAVADNTVVNVWADGTRVGFTGTNNHTGKVTFYFPSSVSRLTIRMSDNEDNGLVSGGLSLECTSSDTTSKWHLFGSSPKFTENIKSYAATNNETTNPANFPYDYRYPSVDLNTVDGDKRFTPVLMSKRDDSSWIGREDTWYRLGTIHGNGKAWQVFVFEPSTAGQLIPHTELTATMSSVYNNMGADYCINGKIDLEKFSADTDPICHSDSSATSNSWLKIDLGKERFVQGLNIYNRISRDEDELILKSRLFPFEVYTSTDGDYTANTANLCSSQTDVLETDLVDVRCNGNHAARYVHIVLPGTERWLNLREVEVLEAVGEHSVSARNYDSSDNLGGSIFPSTFQIGNEHSKFTASLTTGAAPSPEEDGDMSLLTRMSGNEGLALITFKAGTFELKLNGVDTGKVLDANTSYTIACERVNHYGNDIFSLSVDDEIVFEVSADDVMDISSDAPHTDTHENFIKAPWLVGASYERLIDLATVDNVPQANRVLSDHHGCCSNSMLDSPKGWATRHSTSADSLIIDLGEVKYVVGFTFQGRHDHPQAVKEVTAYISDDNSNWKKMNPPGQWNVNIPAWRDDLDVNSQADRDTKVFSSVAVRTGRYVKIIPRGGVGTNYHQVLRVAVNTTPVNPYNVRPFIGSVSNPKFELLSNEDGSVVTGVTRSPTARPTYHADATLACKDASKIEFSTYYHTENGHFHVPLDTQSKGVDFSVSGPDGVNIAMLPEGVGLDDLTQGYTAGYEIYLGAEEEPFVHISNKFGDTPDAVAHLTGQQDIPNAFDAKRDFSIIVDGTSVTVYQGHSHKEDKVALVSFDSGVDKTITNAIFSYGYGDLECGVASE